MREIVDSQSWPFKALASRGGHVEPSRSAVCKAGLRYLFCTSASPYGTPWLLWISRRKRSRGAARLIWARERIQKAQAIELGAQTVRI